MAGRVLLDTNIVVALFKGDPAVTARLLLASEVFLSSVALGEIKNELRSKGRPIPENDIWIAACALQHGLVLATRDRHFENLENLDVQSW